MNRNSSTILGDHHAVDLHRRAQDQLLDVRIGTSLAWRFAPPKVSDNVRDGIDESCRSSGLITELERSLPATFGRALRDIIACIQSRKTPPDSVTARAAYEQLACRLYADHDRSELPFADLRYIALRVTHQGYEDLTSGPQSRARAKLVAALKGHDDLRIKRLVAFGVPLKACMVMCARQGDLSSVQYAVQHGGSAGEALLLSAHPDEPAARHFLLDHLEKLALDPQELLYSLIQDVAPKPGYPRTSCKKEHVELAEALLARVASVAAEDYRALRAATREDIADLVELFLKESSHDNAALEIALSSSETQKGASAEGEERAVRIRAVHGHPARGLPCGANQLLQRSCVVSVVRPEGAHWRSSSSPTAELSNGFQVHVGIPYTT